jgi:hypothetical protein
LCLFNTLQHYEELNNPYVNMNQQNQRPDYLNMMSAHNYSNITAPHETEYEHDNRWVWNPQTEDSNYMSTNANHQLLSVKDSVGTK